MRYILLFLYIIINIFFFTMNYEMFTILDYINYGAGTLYISPILFVDFIGLLFVVIFFLADSVKEEKKNKIILQKNTKIDQLEKELEITMLKLENNYLKEEIAINTLEKPLSVDVINP